MDNSLRIFTGDFAKRLPDEALKLDVLPVMVFPENVQLRRIFNMDRKPFVKSGRTAPCESNPLTTAAGFSKAGPDHAFRQGEFESRFRE